MPKVILFPRGGTLNADPGRKETAMPMLHTPSPFARCTIRRAQATMEATGLIDSVLALKGRQVYGIKPTATVYEAIELMAEKNVGALVVMEGDRLAGLVSERDYTRKVALKGKSSRDIEVREIMSASPITVTPLDTVETCMRLMNDHRVRHLPVLDQGKVVGIVSIGNLVNWIISAQSAAISQLKDYITGQYPG